MIRTKTDAHGAIELFREKLDEMGQIGKEAEELTERDKRELSRQMIALAQLLLTIELGIG